MGETGSTWERQEVHGEDWMYMKGQEIHGGGQEVHGGDWKCLGVTGGTREVGK